MQIADCWLSCRKNDLAEQDPTTDPILAARGGNGEGQGAEEALTGAARV